MALGDRLNIQTRELCPDQIYGLLAISLEMLAINVEFAVALGDILNLEESNKRQDLVLRKTQIVG
jgi:hypothetical protein